MFTKCTSPNAMFPNADMALVSFLESRGLDMPCELIPAFLAGTLGLALLAIVCLFSGLALITRN